ncbi:MAG: hypothetical protein ABWY92_00505 [Xanthobacteraceae bacterium]|jgi:hypothetical protein
MRRAVILIVTGCLAVAMAMPVTRAQTPAPKNEPKEKAINVPTTPERVIADIEAGAKRQQERGNTPPRAPFLRIGRPDNAAEFAAMRKYSVMLLTVLSQKPEELPLKRAYIRSNGPELPLQKLSSWRSELDSKLLGAKMYGPHREDGFYLVPIGPLTRDGMITIEFATAGVGLNVLKLPSEAVVRRGSLYADPDAPPDAKPDPRALKALIERKFTGFPMPKYP